MLATGMREDSSIISHAHGQFSIAPSMVPWHAHEGKVGMCVILLVGYATLEAAEH